MKKEKIFVPTGDVKIVLESIPGVEMRFLCRTIAEAAERFYSIPENRAAFEKWLKEKDSQKAC